MFNRKIIEGPWGGGNLFVKEMTNFLRQKDHEVCFDFEDEIMQPIISVIITEYVPGTNFQFHY